MLPTRPGPRSEIPRSPTDAIPDGGVGWMVAECGPLGWGASMPLDLSRLAASVDYVALRNTGVGLAITERVTKTVSESGTACATASEPVACRAELEAVGPALLPPGVGCGTGCPSASYLVTTQGNAVRLLRTPAEARTLFGAIDSVGEALALLYLQDLPLSCDRSTGVYRVVADGYEVRRYEASATCAPSQTGYVTRFISRDGSVTVTAQEVLSSMPTCPIGGRRPEGWRSADEQVDRACALGAYFARAAALEAASIPAFGALAQELIALAAPMELLAAVRAAIADERVHAREVGRLAQRFGATWQPPQVEPHPLRTAFALALDNVVEGCVRESFGALLATYQAAHARDLDVRNVMARIARDETRHAALAFALQAWLEPQLDASQREAVATAREQALKTLRVELSRPYDEALHQTAGLPPAPQQELLLAQLEALFRAPARVAA